MNKSITQTNQNDKQISKSIKRFFTRFYTASALKASNMRALGQSILERRSLFRLEKRGK